MECKCGCGVTLRKDNKTGYQKGHRSCVVCGSKTKGQNECCSKSCSTKLHWIRNPEMRENRIWNDARLSTREQNRDSWVSNLSNACKGREPWNKGTKGLQEAWNKGLPAEEQPFYGKCHTDDTLEKRKETNLKRYGVENCWSMVKQNSISKLEKLYGDTFLPDYESNARVGKYKVDFLNSATKHIVEVYGDYWHCHSSLFDDNQYHSQLKMTAYEKRQKDLHRQQYLESKGYKVDIVWEHEALAQLKEEK